MTGEAVRSGGEATQPRLVLRRFGPEDEETLIGWFATPEELQLFAGDSLRWPLDRRQLELIRGDSTVRAWTAIEPQRDEALAIGHIELTRLPDRRWYRLARVAIAPQRRGLGLGLALVNAAVEEALRLGAVGVDLRVYHSNAAARATYRAAGFADIGRDRAQPDLRWMIREFGR
jgi:ribosomal protein S18 acetylase RimI-like enzyme